MLVTDNRTEKTNRAIITVATGDYAQYAQKLVRSARYFFNAHSYIFTDQPELTNTEPNTTTIQMDHLGWPRMPLLRFELIHKTFDLFKENYLFIMDADTQFMRPVGNSLLDHRVAVLHRNIMRFRDEFNYEKRQESTAFIAPNEGEKYYACGFVGGSSKELRHMSHIISDNIRSDIRNKIRARWGDESHLNRYLVDNRPTLVLPPSYMCPETNPYYKPFIIHRAKDFKAINKVDTDRYLTVDPKDYDHPWPDLTPIQA